MDIIGVVGGAEPHHVHLTAAAHPARQMPSVRRGVVRQVGAYRHRRATSTTTGALP